MLHSKRSSPDTGLLALGSSDGWHVAVDQSLDGEEHWTLEIDGPRLYVTFLAKNPDVIGEAIVFLEAGLNELKKNPLSESLGEMTLGKWGAAAVSLLWDNEGAPRCVLLIGPHRNCTMRFVLHEREIQAVLDALKQVTGELRSQ